MRAPGEAYALVRAAKLKDSISASAMNRAGQTNGQAIDDATAHELRLKAVANADPSRRERNILMIFRGHSVTKKNFREAGEEGLLRPKLFRELVQAKLLEFKSRPPKKNSVLGQQVQCSASFEFFSRKPTTDGSPSLDFVEDEKFKRWLDETIKFVGARFGKLVVCAVLHLDEMTPHLTFVVVPLVEKELCKLGRGKKRQLTGEKAWRLCAADMFNPYTLARLWDDYAAAMKPFGLRRPPGSKIADHSTVRDFYGAVIGAKKEAQELEKTMLLELPAVLKSYGLAESAETFRKRAETQLEEQKKALKKLLEGHMYRQRYLEMASRTETLLRKELREQKEKLERSEKERVRLHEFQAKWVRFSAELPYDRLFSRIGLPIKGDGCGGFYRL